MLLSEKWIDRFYNLALHVAQWSNDQHTQVGAIIVNQDKRVLSMGYNGLPSGTNDNIEKRFKRPLKYKYMVHAEFNAIVNAARLGHSVNEGIMFCTLFPCASCAHALINAGISAIYTPKPNLSPQYEDDVEIALESFREANVQIFYFEN